MRPLVGSPNSGDCKAEHKEYCKGAGSGPSCLDKSLPANSGLSDGKAECIKRVKKECDATRLRCMTSCHESFYASLTAPSSGELARYSQLRCHDRCYHEGDCDYLPCHCLRITCTSCVFGDCSPEEEKPADSTNTAVDPIGSVDSPSVSSAKRFKRGMQLTGSNYGEPIEVVYGRGIVRGNIIWIGNYLNSTIVEGNTSTSGAPEVGVSPDARFDFALSLGEGPMEGFTRLWFNDVLVLDNTAEVAKFSRVFFGANRTTTTYRAQGADVIFYPGTEDQLANPVMGEDVAYRGLSYLFFKGFSLSGTNGTFPDIRVEVVRNASYDFTPRVSSNVSATAGDKAFSADTLTGQLSFSGSLNTVSVIRPDVVSTVSLPSGADEATMVVLPSGYIVAQYGTIAPSRPVNMFNSSGLELASFSLGGASTVHTTSEIANTFNASGTYSLGAVFNSKEFYVPISGNHVAFLPITTQPAVISPPERIYNNLSGGPVRLAQAVQYTKIKTVGRTDAYESVVVFTNSPSSVNAITCHEILAHGTNDGFGAAASLATVNNLFTLTVPSSAWDNIPDAELICGFFDGGINAGWILVIRYNGLQYRAIRYLMGNNTIDWFTELAEPPVNPARIASTPEVSNFYEFATATGKVMRLDRRDGTLRQVSTLISTIVGRQIYDANTDAILYITTNAGGRAVARASSQRLSYASQALTAVIENILTRVDVPRDAFDTLDLSSISVVGYKVNSSDDVSTILKDLSDVYLFTFFQSDGNLIFKRRRSEVSLTIPYEDISSEGAGQETSGFIAVKDAGTSRSIANVTVTYTDATLPALPRGTQRFTRFDRNPESRFLETAGMREVGDQISVNTEAIITPTYARQVAEILYTLSQQSSVSTRIKLGPKYNYLAPGDVVTFPNSVSLAGKWRVSRFSSGADRSIELEVYRDDPEGYAGAFGVAGTVLPIVPLPAIPEPSPLLSPYVWTARWFKGQDTDPNKSGTEQANRIARPIFYAGALYSSTVPFVGPIMISKGSDAPYLNIGEVNAPLYVGTVLDFPNNQTDAFTRQSAPDDYITVRFEHSSVVTQLSNSSDLRSFRDVVTDYGRNVIFVGKEIIQYGTYTVAGDGITVTFRDLFRGRRGTDVYARAGHVPGTPVAVYHPDSVIDFTVSMTEAAGEVVAVSTTTSSSPILGRSAAVIGDTESIWALAPEKVTVTDVTPTGFAPPTPRKLYFKFHRRSQIDDEFRDDDFTTLVFPAGSTFKVSLFKGTFTKAQYLQHKIDNSLSSLYIEDVRFPWQNPVSFSSAAWLNNVVNTQNQGDYSESPSDHFSIPGYNYNHLTTPLVLVFEEGSYTVDTLIRPWYLYAVWNPGPKPTFVKPDVMDIW